MNGSEILLYALLIGAGIGSGFINTMAGGGSMLTLPALMLLGLPAGLANGTNRLAVLTQSVAGAWAFHRRGRLPVEEIPRVLLPTIAGAAVGAAGASYAPEGLLKPALLLTMLAMAAITLLRPAMVAREEKPEGGTGAGAGGEGEGEERPPDPRLAFLGLFLAGLYGGFIQAGVGFVLLLVFGAAMRLDVLRANALKMVCTTLFGAVALVIFALRGQVDWPRAAVLAVATVIGSQLGVRFSLKVGAKPLRVILFVTVVAACIGAYLKS